MKIKNLIIATAILFFAVNCFGQKSDSVSIDYRYLGLSSSFNVHTDSFYTSNYASARVGGGATWYVSKTLKISGWAAFETDNQKKLYSKVMIGLKYRPNKTEVSFGSIPSLTANLRPLPPTMWGHFEPWLSSQLPGCLPGVGIKHFAKNIEVGLGCYYINSTTVQYQSKFKFKKTTLVGFYENEKKFGGAMMYEAKNWTGKALMTENLYGLWSSIKLYPSKGILYYFDLGLNKDQKLVRAESGFLKTFDVKPVSGVLGIGYAHEARIVKFYLLMSLL